LGLIVLRANKRKGQDCKIPKDGGHFKRKKKMASHLGAVGYTGIRNSGGNEYTKGGAISSFRKKAGRTSGGIGAMFGGGEKPGLEGRQNAVFSNPNVSASTLQDSGKVAVIQGKSNV